jgi:hypothetical protein
VLDGGIVQAIVVNLTEVVQKYGFLLVGGPDATLFNLSQVRTISRGQDGGCVLTFAPNHVITLRGPGHESFLKELGL